MKFDNEVYCKANADSKKYFALFDKNIPNLKDGSKVLLYTISNPYCIAKMIEKNPNCEYYVCDTKGIFKLASFYCQKFCKNAKLNYIETDEYIHKNKIELDCIISSEFINNAPELGIYCCPDSIKN